MWNAGYDDGEYQNGYGYDDSYQQDNQYSSYYQQPPYQMPYQSTGYQEPYFTTPQQPPYQDSCSDYYQPPSFQQSYFQQSEEYYPPQPQCQQNDEMAELRAMMQEYTEFQQRSSTQLAELKATTIALQSNICYLNQEWSREDRVEVLNNDIEIEVVDEDVNDESDNESDSETDWLPLEAAPNVDSTCLESFEDGIDGYNEHDALMYELIMGNGLTSEQGERLIELTQAIAAPVSKTEITESEPQSIEHMHHSEPSSSPTCADLILERSEEAIQIPSVDQTSVELGNEIEQESPHTQTVAVEHSVGKSLVWGKTKIFPLTDKGENGGYMSGVVVKEAACDPESKGRYLGRSYGGFRDQFYIGPCGEVSGVRSKKEYHGPWFND